MRPRTVSPRTFLLAIVLIVSTVAACSTAGAQDDVAPPEPEKTLRTETEAWLDVPYLDHGTTRDGIGSSGLVSEIFKGMYGVDIPITHEQQIRTGRLVERNALQPGDLVFFEGRGFGPFRARFVAIFLGDDQVALAHRDTGVAIVPLTGAPGGATFRTARRIPLTPTEGAPAFDMMKYGANRAALLRDIANAWSGTLYQQGGTTFDGIGNEEFVRAVYEVIHETDLDGTTRAWATLGQPVTRDSLEPGDFVFYVPPGLTGVLLRNQRHVGLYLGDGDFVHAARGSAVTISQIDDERWSQAFRMARRIDPEALDRPAEPRDTAALDSSASTATSSVDAEPADAPAVSAPAAVMPMPPLPAPAVAVAATIDEQRLREMVRPWEGTPYRIGGTTKAGVDCSAFVRAVYTDTYGVELPRTAAEQERLGDTIHRRDLQTGDLVFFRTQGMGPLFRSRHVGVYLGNGEFAHASGTRGVTVSRLDHRYWNKRYATARRLSRPSL